MRCPGQDMRFWKPGDIFETPCPKCAKKIEFFKDDVRRKCECGHEVVNPKMDLGCALWCQYAEQCVGNIPEGTKIRQRGGEKDFLRERILLEMKKFWGTHDRRIKHALKVARYAEAILKMEGGNPLVIIGAAYLHELGGYESEGGRRNTPDPARREGPAMIREILERLAARTEAIAEIVDVIDRLHRPRDGESLNVQILYEAHGLAMMEERQDGEVQGQWEKELPSHFKTTTGRQLLREFSLGS